MLRTRKKQEICPKIDEKPADLRESRNRPEFLCVVDPYKSDIYAVKIEENPPIYARFESRRNSAHFRSKEAQR